mmetsp:Transcript_3660/g.4982  ORF Transcript_3660/g.4982 Transcript_3660/m.4982 type:complete len:247 (-) Transcript_3660:28-768(-)
MTNVIIIHSQLNEFFNGSLVRIRHGTGVRIWKSCFVTHSFTSIRNHHTNNISAISLHTTMIQIFLLMISVHASRWNTLMFFRHTFLIFQHSHPPCPIRTRINRVRRPIRIAHRRYQCIRIGIVQDIRFTVRRCPIMIGNVRSRDQFVSELSLTIPAWEFDGHARLVMFGPQGRKRFAVGAGSGCSIYDDIYLKDAFLFYLFTQRVWRNLRMELGRGEFGVRGANENIRRRSGMDQCEEGCKSVSMK